MKGKLALAIVTCVLVGLLSIQTIKSQTPTSPPPTTEAPQSTAPPQPTPIAPWQLMLAVFASVALTALVLTGFQKLRARQNKPPIKQCTPATG